MISEAIQKHPNFKQQSSQAAISALKDKPLNSYSLRESAQRVGSLVYTVVLDKESGHPHNQPGLYIHQSIFTNEELATIVDKIDDFMQAVEPEAMRKFVARICSKKVDSRYTDAVLPGDKAELSDPSVNSTKRYTPF